MGKKKNRRSALQEPELKKSKFNIDEPYKCEACNVLVFGGYACVIEHFDSSNHKRLSNVYCLSQYFLDFGLDWDSKNSKLYYCELHKMNLAADCKVLCKHIDLHHPPLQNNLNLNNIKFDLPVLNNRLIVHKSKIWLTDFPKGNLLLNEYVKPYEIIDKPIRVIENDVIQNFVCDLGDDVFNSCDLIKMLKVSSWLEKNGNNVSRAEAKGSTALSAFGMRWARGDLGWYVHKQMNCYKVAEEFASFVSKRLRTFFPSIFNHLEKIKENEGFGNGKACIGDSPFTSFVVSRDFNCNPHLDKDDYDIGFIIWLKEDLDEDSEDFGEFVFPELKVRFNVGHGDVLVFRPNHYYHCTWRLLKKRKQIGIAFFQKNSLFRQLKKLENDKIASFYDDILKELIEIRWDDFEKKKAAYVNQCEEGELSFVDF